MTFLTLAAGLLTFAAALGVGSLVLAALGVRLAQPWRATVTALLGLQVESALVQVVAMAGVSTRPVLVALWAAFVTAGAVGVVRAWRAEAPRLAPPGDGWRPVGIDEWLPLALGVAAVCANLLLAAAPSTKIDELYYHMLLPRRIVADGGLRFYLYPWESPLPQMAYQVGAAPLHALGLPDAPNATSWALGATLAWLGWHLLASDARTRRFAPWWVGAVTVGLYTAVWHVTGGAHALGDLALAAALVAVVDARRAGVAENPASYAFALGVLTWSAASSKATLVPVSALLALWAVARAWRSSEGATASRVRAGAGVAAPWLLFGAPLVAWTWRASGAPYGALAAWWFGHTAYDAEPIRDLIANTAAANRTLPYSVPRELMAQHSPLLWLAAFAALVTLRLPRATRAGLLALVALHAALVFGLVSWDPRFLGGVPFGLALLWAMHGPWSSGTASRWPARRATAAAALLLLAPWLAVQLYYGVPFFSVALGLTSRERFRARFVALDADYRALDRLLPRDALLLSELGRTSAVYAPRPELFSARDLGGPAGRRRAYVIGFSCDAGGARGPVVYTNPGALIAVYRTPGHPPDTFLVCVRKLEGGGR